MAESESTRVKPNREIEIAKIEREMARNGAIPTGEIVQAGSGGAFTDDELRNLKTFDDFMNEISSRDDFELALATELGNGFSVLADKHALIGVEFVIIDWRFNESKSVFKLIDGVKVPSEFVSVAVVTRGNEKWIFNDGSTGVYAQLKSIVAEIPVGKRLGIHCKSGLRASTYDVTDDKGNISEATTFYLDLS